MRGTEEFRLQLNTSVHQNTLAKHIANVGLRLAQGRDTLRTRRVGSLVVMHNAQTLDLDNRMAQHFRTDCCGSLSLQTI